MKHLTHQLLMRTSYIYKLGCCCRYFEAIGNFQLNKRVSSFVKRYSTCFSFLIFFVGIKYGGSGDQGDFMQYQSYSFIEGFLKSE